jgi:hypothetical protein
MQKSALLAALRTELQQHNFSNFVNQPPSAKARNHCYQFVKFQCWLTSVLRFDRCS